MVLRLSKQPVLLIGNFLSSHLGTRGPSEELAVRLRRSGWTLYAASAQRGRLFRLLDMVASIWRLRNCYAVASIEVYSGLAFVWAEIAAYCLRAIRKPYLLTLHGGGLVEFAQRNPARVAKLLQQSQIAVSPSLFLQAGLRTCSAAIRYLPNAVDVSQHEFRPRHRPAPRFIWLRAFHETYQPQLAVRAVACLLKEFEDLTLTMIGPDKKDGSLTSAMRLAESLGIASRVHFVGKVPRSEVPIWLARGDIFLNTTLFESFGVSVVEAALVGLPIVTTNVGELPFLWQHEKTALLVPQNEPKAMASAIRRVLIEPGLAEGLSRNARLRAEQFDWSIILPQWEQLFREAARV